MTRIYLLLLVLVDTQAMQVDGDRAFVATVLALAIGYGLGYWNGRTDARRHL